MPVYCSPTALQRLFHHEGERAMAHAVQKFGTIFGVSSLGTVSLEEISSKFSFPHLSVLLPQGPRPEPTHAGPCKKCRRSDHDVDSRFDYGWEPGTRPSYRLLNPLALEPGRLVAVCSQAEVGDRVYHSRAF